MSERREVAPGVWIEAEKLPPEAMDRIESRGGRVSESRVDSCQWPTSGIGVALRRSDDWPFSTGPQAIGLISGFYTQVEVVPASLARELEAELRVATDETQTEAKPESLNNQPPVSSGRVTVDREDAEMLISPGQFPRPSVSAARARLRASLAAADKGENE